MPSEQALSYQTKKLNLPLEVQNALNVLDQKINLHRLLEIASGVTGHKCTSAEAVAAGKPHPGIDVNDI
jgi:hypothetical protein